MDTLYCPVCGKKAELVKGDKVYPHRSDLRKKKFYACLEHDAFVGCHPDTNIAMGYLATASLRKLRSQVHRLYDPLWREKYFKSRSKAYSWFAKKMQLPASITHVAMFDESQCRKALMLLEAKWEEIKQEKHQQMLDDKWKPKENLFED